MNPKTEAAATEVHDAKKQEFSPMFLRWIISLTLVTLLFVLLSDEIFRTQPRAFTPMPWVMAGGIVIQQGLDMFSGLQPAPVSTADDWAMLTGLLTLFVLAPTLLFFSWRTLATTPAVSGLRPATIGFGFGVILMTMSSLGVGAGAIFHPQVASRMRTAQALGENRDMVIRGLWRVSVDAYQYKILPKSLNGGGGSYKGYEVPASLRQFEGNDYIAVSANDTSCTLLGTSSIYTDSAIQGLYDRQGKLSGAFKFIGWDD